MSIDVHISTINAEVLTLRHLILSMLVLRDKNELIVIKGHLNKLAERFDKLPEEAVMKFADTPQDVAEVISNAEPYRTALNDMIDTINQIIETK